MDGENNGKPVKIDDLGGKPTIFGNIHFATEHRPFAPEGNIVFKKEKSGASCYKF